jgi:hypothetical protein
LYHTFDANKPIYSRFRRNVLEDFWIFVKFDFVKGVFTHVFLAVLAIVLLLSFSAVGLLSVSQSLTSSGTISTANVSVFSDSACTIPLSSISWGMISPGASVSKTIYILNTGNIPLTLTMTTNGWSPSQASSSISLSWNRENSVLNAGQSIDATLTLVVASSISGITSFSVNIVIAGTG